MLFRSLISLENCPTSVGGNFYCYNNKLTSLQYCPKSVGGDFYCSSNQLSSLQYCPSIGCDFYCDDNPFDFSDQETWLTAIKTHKNVFKYIPKPTEAMIELYKLLYVI